MSSSSVIASPRRSAAVRSPVLGVDGGVGVDPASASGEVPADAEGVGVVGGAGDEHCGGSMSSRRTARSAGDEDAAEQGRGESAH